MTGWLAVWAAAALGSAGAPGFEVSRGRPACVAAPAAASAAEMTAAREVAGYLERVTGAPVRVVDEAAAPATRRIFVGATAAARRAGIRADRLGPEEWRIRAAGGDLFLVGGGPRGTLYAAYRFLEDEVGVHWWSPWDETVPRRAAVRVAAMDRQGAPAFRYRDIYMLYGGDGGRFAVRNRLNRDGDAPIGPGYGGSQDYGPPYHVHTAYSFVPPAERFAEHPEWYSLIGGKRTAENGQLCWSSPTLRAFFRERLLATIASSRRTAQAAGLPPPAVYSISQNDCLGPCQCSACQAIARAEGSEAGPLLDFVNEMADAVRGPYPDVFIDTLAYQYTQRAPKTIRPRDNVIIRLCDTEADMLKPITAPANRAFREHIQAWAAISRNLRIWDYAVTYGTVGMPLPTAHTFGPDYRFYLAHRVEGVFTELEYELLADMRDFKVWMMMKTLENPQADYERLTGAFMRGCYGPAGGAVRAYLRALEAEAAARGSRSTCWDGAPSHLSYLNPAFIVRAQALFDGAERGVRGDGTLLRRVRQARLALDRATLALWNRLAAGWKGPGALPLHRAAVAQRALATWLAMIDQRIPEGRRAAERQTAEAEMRRFAGPAEAAALPAQFRDRPAGTVYDFTAAMSRNFGGVVKVVPDAEAETGSSNRLDLTAADVEHAERYTLPMPCGFYTPADKGSEPGDSITAGAIAGPGYHWYRLGSFTPKATTYVWFFWSWFIQFDIDNVYDPLQPNRRFEAWARVRFEGPRFPHARPGQRDAIWVERLLLVAAPAG